MAQVNPVDDQSLIAVFPIVHRFRGCIGLSLSLDGLNWSPVTPLRQCDTIGDRTIDQPVAGIIRPSGGNVLWLYVHESVPKIGIDTTASSALTKYLKEREPRAEVFRYAIPIPLFRRWASRAREFLTSLSRQHEIS